MGRLIRPEDEHAHDRDAPEPSAKTAPEALSPGTSPAAILALQRSCGNAAVQRMLAARRPVTGKGAPVAEDEESMLPVTGDTGGGVTTPAPAGPVSPPSPPAPTAGPKLKKKNVRGPKPVDSGGFEWVIQWELDETTTTGGWVVQKVELDHSVKSKDDKPVDPGKAGGLDPGWYPVWEAWQINKDQKVTTYAETGDVEDDTYGSGPLKDTKGSLTVRGTPEFYDGLTLPSSFKVTNKAPTWILPATKGAPALAGGTGAISHDLTATWDGTAADKTTKISTK
jgi:hypothetical protein